MYQKLFSLGAAFTLVLGLTGVVGLPGADTFEGYSPAVQAQESAATPSEVDAALTATTEAALAAGTGTVGVSDLLLVEYAAPEVKETGRTLVALELGEEEDALENATVDGNKDTDIIALEEGEDIEAVVARLQTQENADLIKNVQPVYNYRPMYTPTNDPLWSQQWYFQNGQAGMNIQSAWSSIGAQEGVTCGTGAGERCGGDPDVKIAVIDTGVNINASDFSGANIDTANAMRFYNNSDNTCAPGTYYVGFQQNPGSNPPVLNFCQDTGSQFDEQGHGTGVASLIFAQDNVTGTVGAAYNTTLLPIGVHGAAFNTYFIAESITYAADNGADIINLSLGSPFYDSYLEDVIDDVVAQGVIVIAASGNCAEWTPNCDWDGNGTQTPGFFAEEDNALMYPAGFDSVVAVGASTNVTSGGGIERAYYSNFGPHLDVVAPVGDAGESPTGNRVLCGVVRSGCSSVNSYKTSYGTSYASPQIAGLAGLLESQNPNLTTAGFRTFLQEAAEDLGATGRDNDFGYGLPKANRLFSSISVEITSPATGGGIPVTSINDNLVVTAAADDPNSSINKVEFFNRGQKVGEDTTAPYQYTFPASQAVPRNYVVTARAINAEGESKTSAQVIVQHNYDPTPWRTDNSFLSRHAMNLFEFQGDLYQTAVGFDDRIYTRHSRNDNVHLSTNSSDWTNWSTSNDPLEFTAQPIYSAVYNNRIYQVHIGGNGVVFTRSSSDGENWTGWSFDRGQADLRTSLPVDMISFNGRLYQVMVARRNNRIYTRSSTNGVDWTEWVTGNDPLEQTSYAVHLAVFDDKLYQTHVGGNGKIFTRSTPNGTSFTGWTFGNDPLEDTRAPVTIRAFDGKLHESHQGISGVIFTRASLDGVNWSSWIATPDLTNDEITLAVFDDHLYQGFIGRDNNRLYIRRFE